MKTSLRDVLEIIGLFVLSLTVFTWGIGNQEIIGFESRFYMFALEMWRHGPTWFPTTYGVYYPDYPATSTLMIYLTSLFFGALNKFSAVFPSAIAAAGTVVFTYLIGKERDKRYGLYAVLFLFMTIMFLKSARSVSLDVYTAFITTACFYVIYSAEARHLLDREWIVYPLLILGFAFRGPIGLVIPAGVVCVFYLQSRNFKSFFFAAACSFLVLMVCLICLLTLADNVGGDGFVRSVLQMEMVGRLEDGQISRLFYLTNSLHQYALSFPLAILIALGTLYYEQRLHYQSPELKLLLLLLGWTAVILLGMSIPGDKKARYVLAIAPAISLMAAYFFVSIKKDRYFYRLQWLFIRILIFFPAILYLFLRRVIDLAGRNAINFEINYLLMTQIFFIGIALNLLFYVLFEKKPKWRDTGVLLVATSCFILGYLKVVEPMEQYFDKTREFVHAMELQRMQYKAQLVFYRENPDGLPIKYLINTNSQEAPVFLENENDLSNLSTPSYIVTSRTYFSALTPAVSGKFEVVGYENIGHVPVIVFRTR